MKYLVIISTLFLFSCKKDSAPLIDVKDSSTRFKTLTSHYWQLRGQWNDTTDYAKAHPELVPLSTSIDNFFFTDSCKYYTCSYYNPDGFLYIVKGKWCGYPNNNLNIVKDYPWLLTNNDQVFNNNYKIITLNDSVFKIYERQIYNFTKELVTVYEFKAFVYK